MALAEVESIDRGYRLLLHSDYRRSKPVAGNGKINTYAGNNTISLERSMEPEPAILGVHLLWVHSKFRRQGLARKLLDTARDKTFYGFVVPRHMIAFSSPTQAGIAFAMQYCHFETQPEAHSNQPTVLVYECA